jgi:hypothetical protein
MTEPSREAAKALASDATDRPVKNPLKCALEKVLQGQARVWSYQHDFDELWDLLNLESCGLAGKQVILSSRTPPGNCYPVHTDPFVSPIVWAVCAASRLNKPESLRVIILDLAPAIHAGDLLRDQVAVFREESIPWLRIVPWTELIKGNAAEIGRALLGVRESSSADLVAQKAALEQLRQTLRLKLAGPAEPDRHAISNLIGPMILLNGSPKLLQSPTALGDAVGADHLTAINCLLKVCDLIRNEKIRTEHGRTGVKKEAPPSSADLRQWTASNGSIEFILVDDQTRHGWGQLLCDMLGASQVSPAARSELTTIGQACDGTLIVSVSESAQFILEELERPGPSDRRFNFRLGSDADHQVLLLDLRLFAGKPVREEAMFFSRLAKIARARFCDRSDLPWPGFTKEEVDRLESWLRSAVEDNRADRSDSLYLEVLTLLPRVLALSDLSLPIVIYSSTAQRKVTDRLHDYRNIVLDFDKPAVHNYRSDDLVAQTYVSFRNAVERALRLCKARALCRSVLRLADEADRYSINRRSDRSVVHYELYIDESGSSIVEGDPDTNPDDPGRFTIGGLVVEHREALGPDELHRKMEAQNPPLRWWPNSPGEPFLAKCGKPLEELPNGALQLSDHEIVERFLKLAPRDSVIGVCLEYRDDGPAQPVDEIEALIEADNRYRRMVSYLLEAVLFDVLPEIVVNKGATLSVFVATRVRKAKDFKGGKALLARLMDRFGFDGDLNAPEPYVQTMDEPFVVSIMSDIKKRRPDDKLVVGGEHMRGVVLHYPEKGGRGRTSPKWANTRHQHYLADIVARGARRFGSRLQHKWSELFARGMYNVFDARLVALTESVRAISRGDLSAAVLELQSFDCCSPIPKTSSSWLVIKRLRKALLQGFSGSDFINTSVQIGRQRAVAQREAEGEIGSVKFYDAANRFGYIWAQGRDCKFSWGDWRSATQPRKGESVRFVRISRPELSADRVEWVRSLT